MNNFSKTFDYLGQEMNYNHETSLKILLQKG
jgi:hypothetical protein